MEINKTISEPAQKEICEEWPVPKTIVNTITKKLEAQELLKLTHISGKRREMEITLTNKGMEYVRKIMSFIYRAEDNALKITLEKYPETFIDAPEFFGAKLKEEFEESLNNESVE